MTQVIYNEEGEAIGMEYVRDAYEQEIAYCEEMDRRAEDPLYAASVENQRWYNIACSIFEERGIEVPYVVKDALAKELRAKQRKIEEEKSKLEAQPAVDWLNKRFPNCHAFSRYVPESYDEIAYTEIDFDGQLPPKEEMYAAIDEASNDGICLEDFIHFRWLY